MTGKPKVVVIEDNEIFAALMVAALEEDFEILTGSNGLQGIALCLEGGVSAVVTDIGMPDFDGLSMIKEFANNPVLTSIPVVVVTATHFTRLSREDISRFPQVKRILSKTESIERLASEVKAVLAESGMPS
jgi:CheY-like chemotaxis protein